MRSRSAPLVTYRVQLRPGFGFAEAAELAPYLSSLGVSHIYLSPVLAAVAGSGHGYDVVDPTRLRDELGGQEGFDRLCEALERNGLGQVLDIVPNHMAIGVPENRWWWDVLENGPSSLYASYFDVDWDRGPHNRILLPVLPGRYGEMVEAGLLRLGRSGGGFVVAHDGWTAPLSPPTVAPLLTELASGLDGPAAEELAALGADLGALPPSWVTETQSVRARHVLKERISARLAQLWLEAGELAEELDRRLGRLSDDPAGLDALLERQNYRLAQWRSAGDELDYRRFFDIGSLIGVRVEDELVFADSHALLLEWLAVGRIDGVRVDHVDGLADPAAYLHRLRQAGSEAWVVVEKILAEGEALPEDWPVAGTTGYEVASALTRVFVDPAGEEALDGSWRAFGGGPDFSEEAHRAKHEVLGGALSPDLSRVSRRLAMLARSELRWRDYTQAELRRACEELLACLPVYRTYVPPDGAASAADAARIEAALADAAGRLPGADEGSWELLRRVLCGEAPFAGSAGSEVRRRFQQLSGAVMAKAAEDCAFYRYLRLVALNEVGADPGSFSLDPAGFHAAAAGWQRRGGSMICTSTHDTKRSEDVRARIGALSEVAEPFRASSARWSAALERHWRGSGPDPAAQYLFIQSVLGILPPALPSGPKRAELAERLLGYMQKAMREAKLRTSWIDPDPGYEAALEAFVTGAIWDEAFMAEAAGVVEACLAEAGWLTSLSITAAKMTLPGVADIYQGCEVWDDSLVDPDNRRPVDFAARERLLRACGGMGLQDLWSDPGQLISGAPKLAVISRLASLRRRRPDCFGAGAGYQALRAAGEGSQHLLCYARSPEPGAPAEVVVVLPRLPLSALRRGGDYTEGIEGWPAVPLGRLAGAVLAAVGGCRLSIPRGSYREVLGDRRVRGGVVGLGEVLGPFPLAVLEVER